MRKIWGNTRFEFAIDLQQWMVGFNTFEAWTSRKGRAWNLFVGPFRFGYMPPL